MKICAALPSKMALIVLDTLRAILAGQVLREIPEKQILALQFCFRSDLFITISYNYFFF